MATGKRGGRIALLILLVLAAFVVLTAWALADEPVDATGGTEVCSVVLHVHTQPGVILPDPKASDPSIGVETGEYHIHNSCTGD